MNYFLYKNNGAISLHALCVFGSTNNLVEFLPIIANKDAIKILDSPLPVFSRPSLIRKGENDDTRNLIGEFAKRLEEVGNPLKRGGNSNCHAPLVFVDIANLPGAYRVTGAYTEENGAIIVEEIVLKKDGKSVIIINEKIEGKDIEEISLKLLEKVLIETGKLK